MWGFGAFLWPLEPPGDLTRYTGNLSICNLGSCNWQIGPGEVSANGDHQTSSGGLKGLISLFPIPRSTFSAHCSTFSHHFLSFLKHFGPLVEGGGIHVGLLRSIYGQITSRMCPKVYFSNIWASFGSYCGGSKYFHRVNHCRAEFSDLQVFLVFGRICFELSRGGENPTKPVKMDVSLSSPVTEPVCGYQSEV